MAGRVGSGLLRCGSVELEEEDAEGEGSNGAEWVDVVNVAKELGLVVVVVLLLLSCVEKAFRSAASFCATTCLNKSLSEPRLKDLDL